MFGPKGGCAGDAEFDVVGVGVDEEGAFWYVGFTHLADMPPLGIGRVRDWRLLIKVCGFAAFEFVCYVVNGGDYTWERPSGQVIVVMLWGSLFVWGK
ncbi:MAG: hypothetical protein Kow0080_04820 [Candidatus Promineifilaceae bacterium]